MRSGRRCAMLMTDRRRRRLASEVNKAEAATAAAELCLSLGSTPSEAGSDCYPLTGRSMADGSGAFSRSTSTRTELVRAKTVRGACRLSIFLCSRACIYIMM
jgi:hypothetical protein